MAAVPKYLWIPSQGRCCYCRQYMNRRTQDRTHPMRVSREHVVPKSCGGKTLKFNIVLACAKCNSDRNHRPLTGCEYFRAREAQLAQIAYLIATRNIKSFADKCVGGWHVKSANGV